MLEVWKENLLLALSQHPLDWLAQVSTAVMRYAITSSSVSR
jgi:hypothetical protein